MAILTVAMVMQSSNVQAIAEEVLSNTTETPAAITETSADIEAQQEGTDENAAETQAETEEVPAEEQAEAETPAAEEAAPAEQEPAAEVADQAEEPAETETLAVEEAEPVDTTATLTFDVSGATLSYDNKSVTADTVEKTAEVSNTLNFKFTVSADEGRQVDSVKAVTDGAESDITADANGTYILAADQLDGTTIKVTTSEIPAEPVEEATAEEEPATAEEPADSDEGATAEEEATETDETAPAESETTDNGDESVSNDAPTVLETEEVVADVSSPAFEGYAYVGDVVVKVTAAEGVLPEGTTVSAYQVNRQDVVDAVAGVVESDGQTELKNSVAIDVTLFGPDGNVIQPESAVNVCFFNTNLGDGEIGVYRVADDASSVQAIGTRQADSSVQSFDVNHFSIYVVTEAGEPVLATYNFIVNGETISTQTVRSGGVLYEPEALKLRAASSSGGIEARMGKGRLLLTSAPSSRWIQAIR